MKIRYLAVVAALSMAAPASAVEVTETAKANKKDIISEANNLGRQVFSLVAGSYTLSLSGSAENGKPNGSLTAILKGSLMPSNGRC